jgi:hypothetical protein
VHTTHFSTRSHLTTTSARIEEAGDARQEQEEEAEDKGKGNGEG